MSFDQHLGAHHLGARAPALQLVVPPGDRALRVAAVLLVAGCAAFWAGAFTPPYRWWFGVPASEYLALVASHRTTWLWIAASFAVGVLLTLAGLVVLGQVLRAAGERLWSELGQVAFLFGAALWLASIAFRATATVAAAEQAGASGAVPAWFAPLQAWAGALFAIYMVLAYLAIAAYGRSLLRTGLAPRWVARAHVAFGLAGSIGFLAQVRLFSPPLLIHLLPGILGVVILTRRRR
jgi:hypothetical protein